MTTYAFPSVAPRSVSITPTSNTAAFRSPLSGAIQTVDRGGETIRMVMNFVNLYGDDKAELQGFLVKLNGQQHRFTAHDPSHIQRGSLGGSPVVSGGGQTGTSINLSGASGSNPWIRTGDHFSIDGHLKIATADANQSGGSVTVTFGPRILVAPSGGASVTVTDPHGTFMLASPATGWNNALNDLGNFTVDCIEDVLA